GAGGGHHSGRVDGGGHRGALGGAGRLRPDDPGPGGHSGTRPGEPAPGRHRGHPRPVGRLRPHLHPGRHGNRRGGPHRLLPGRARARHRQPDYLPGRRTGARPVARCQHRPLPADSFRYIGFTWIQPLLHRGACSPVPAAGGNAKSDKWLLYTDGASRGNPGPASIAYVLTDGQGRLRCEHAETIAEAARTEAEDGPLVAGLERALAEGAESLVVRADSQLVVRQMLGQYRVRSENLIPLFAQARALADRFAAVDFEHVPRKENQRADQLANLALDGKLPGQLPGGEADAGDGVDAAVVAQPAGVAVAGSPDPDAAEPAVE